MGTSKHVIVLLTLALGGLLPAGQDQPAASAPSSQPKASNTRFASCIVRITVDPAIMPLSLENIESLLQSSGVAVKAGREVLGLNKWEDFQRPLVTVEWLNASSAPMPPGARSSRPSEIDWEMMRQMEEIYGPAYRQQMSRVPDAQKKDGAKEDRPGESRQRDGASEPSPQSRSGMSGMAAGGAGGGMGGMGMGSGASSAQEQATEVRRLPDETDVAYRTRLARVRAQEAALQTMKNRGMGGTGMGGMMAGMPGMSMGGAMGGYGVMGNMGFYAAPGSGRQGEGMEQSATVKLYINLPEDVPPLADEFLKGVVRNLQDTLSRAHESCVRDLEYARAAAEAQHRNVESESDGRAGDVARVRQQLETFVDVSALTSQMPLERAVDILRKSVDPPLNITVLWRDMRTNAEAEASSPINIEGSPKMRLATALDLLVKGFDAGVGTARPTWRIKDDTVVIGTTATLGRPQEGAGQPYVENNAGNLAGQRSELTRRVQALELDLAGLDARWHRIVSEIPDVKKRVGERLLQDPVRRELEKLTQIYSPNAGETGGRVYAESTEAKEKTIRAKIELANRQEELSKQAGGSQLDEFNKELTRIVIDQAEKRAQLETVRKQLDEVQKQLAQALAFNPEAARLRLARESLDIAARRVTELQMRLANLQPPMVTVIGAN